LWRIEKNACWKNSDHHSLLSSFDHFPNHLGLVHVKILAENLRHIEEVLDLELLFLKLQWLILSLKILPRHLSRNRRPILIAIIIIIVLLLDIDLRHLPRHLWPILPHTSFEPCECLVKFVDFVPCGSWSHLCLNLIMHVVFLLLCVLKHFI
jgi:hypothetical protein